MKNLRKEIEEFKRKLKGKLDIQFIERNKGEIEIYYERASKGADGYCFYDTLPPEVYSNEEKALEYIIKKITKKEQEWTGNDENYLKEYPVEKLYNGRLLKGIITSDGANLNVEIKEPVTGGSAHLNYGYAATMVEYHIFSGDKLSAVALKDSEKLIIQAYHNALNKEERKRRNDLKENLKRELEV